MIIENTLENKAKFFALYWGQNLCFTLYWTDFSSDDVIEIDGNFLNTIDENDCIFLKSLLTITDEDAKHLCTTSLNIIKNSVDVSSRYMFYSEEADYLRDKGYALPFMNLSVETMVEYGWIKLSIYDN